jgi:5-aminopentanamidase
MEPLLVAAIQATPVPGDVAHNAALGARLVRSTQATVAVLPELFLSAYHPPALRADETAFVRASSDGLVPDPRLQPLVEAAVEGATVIVVGAAVAHDDGRCTCSSLVVGRDGTVTAAYDKQNLWGPDEKELFSPGAQGATLTVDGWRLGLGICYDGCFPEHARAAAVDGAHAYLCPSGYLTGSAHRRDIYYAARALDNTMYVVFANSVGGEAPWRFNGGAGVYDPQGQPVARADDEQEAVVVAALDPAELDRVRSAHSMLADHQSHLHNARATLVA